MAQIKICDLEVHCRIGVTDEERALPQRLLVTVEMVTDISAAARSDRIEETVDYFRVSQDVIQHAGGSRSWKLVEALASELADLILNRYRPESVTIEIKKFPIPQAKFVSVLLTRVR